MRVLITGGAGFIGANLCAMLCAEPQIGQLIVYDDLSSGTLANLDGLDVDVVVGSVLDAAALAETATGVDAVVHLAAQVSVAQSTRDPATTHAVNATGTALVLAAARRGGARQLVLASSAAVYGEHPRRAVTENDRTAPRTPYGASKLAAERYCLGGRQESGLGVLVLRLFNVYGPRQRAGAGDSGVVAAFVGAALAGRPVPVFGSGSQVRDFVYVDTVCAVIRDALLRRACHSGAVNVATGTPTTLRELICALAGALHRPVDYQLLPRRAGDTDWSLADRSLLTRLFPDLPPVPLPAGLAATLAWQHAADGLAQPARS